MPIRLMAFTDEHGTSCELIVRTDSKYGVVLRDAEPSDIALCGYVRPPELQALLALEAWLRRHPLAALQGETSKLLSAIEKARAQRE